MALQDRAEGQRIAPYLTLLGIDPTEVAAVEVLQAGISGADTYRLRRAEGDAVLKVTPPGRGRLAEDRARRELAFYQTLAPTLPLQVPRLLAGAETAGGTVLLLGAYQPSPPVPAWPTADYLEAAAQLARLHAVYWDGTAELAAYSWLRRRTPADDAADLAQAHSDWQTLQAQPAFAAILSPTEYAWIERLLARMDAARAPLAALPPTLCHGDANPWNVLRAADGTLVWTDWQEVGVWVGPEDLAFLLQQATVAGGTVPAAAALTAYHAALAAALPAPPSLPALQQAIMAAELWSRTLYWPAYLTGTPPDHLATMLARIRYLAGALGLAG
jgi:Ser/Thr protein kinase RdoA (MazF antagonist)